MKNVKFTRRLHVNNFSYFTLLFIHYLGRLKNCVAYRNRISAFLEQLLILLRDLTQQMHQQLGLLGYGQIRESAQQLLKIVV